MVVCHRNGVVDKVDAQRIIVRVEGTHEGEGEFGADISSLSVKRKIQQQIQEEDPKRPLSDSELTRVLQREGINIARRTVAKYRDELQIPSSTHRKKIF